MEIPSGRAGHGQPGGPGWPQYRGEDEYARRDAVSTVLHICIVSKVVICSGIFFFLHYCLELFPPWNTFSCFSDILCFALRTLVSSSNFCLLFFHIRFSLTAFSHFTLTLFFLYSRPSFINCSSPSSASEHWQRWILLSISFFEICLCILRSF